jgi:bifunctional DNA-binding transcriptional regulator/antitoxin component of YhaV-PrlF toxin-antitoxin module
MENAMPKVTVLTMGDSGALILPDEILSHLKAKSGDELVVTETARGYHIARHDPGAGDVVDAGEKAGRSPQWASAATSSRRSPP